MPVYMYNKDGAKLFGDDEKIPSDYVDSPEKVKDGKVEGETKEAPKKRGRKPKKVEADDNGA